MPPLVTGAAGFAGGHLVEHLLQSEPHVFAWSGPSGPPPDPGTSAGRVTWRAVDVTDRRAVGRALDEHPPSAVYHCAGVAAVQSAWADAASALRVNAFGTHVLLGELERLDPRVPVLVTGSALVYRPSTDALDEDSPLGPSTPYGVSKLAQELVVFASKDQHVLLTRSFNHAGPRQGEAFVASSFARQIAEAEAGLRAPVLRVGNLDARRDITDVRDTVRAYRLLVANGRPGVPYNVCRGEAYRIGDLLEALVRKSRVGIAVEVDPARLRPSDNPVVLGSAARLHEATGWIPEIALDRTLEDLLAFWRTAVARAPRRV